MIVKNGFGRMGCLSLVWRYLSKMNLHTKSIDYFQIIKLRIQKRRKVVIGQIIVIIVVPGKAIFFYIQNLVGAFFPLEIEEYEQLTFITVPSKFDVGIDADYSWLSNTNEVPNYAKSITLEEFLYQRE